MGSMGNFTINAQGFGKNRIQYTDFDWRFIRSEHFDVYYYSSNNYYLAVFSAQSLEAALKQISEDFKYEITDRITVIIYDSHNDFSQTNVVNLPISSEGIGGVTELFKNRVILPFMGDYSDFRRVLHHELTHAVINDMFYGGSVQSIIQNNIQLQIPGWFNEGMAEFSALGFDTNTDNFLRDATINGYMPPINQLYGYFWYRGGQSVWNYISEEYGRQKIGEIFQRIKTSRSVEFGFRQAIGLSIDELSDRWLASLKKEYWPEISKRDDIKEISTLLTKRELAGTYNTSPAVSPQGDKVALITNKRGYFDVVVINSITGKVIKTLIKGEDNVNFEELNILNPNLSWSPRGDKIALSAKSRGLDNLTIVDYNSGDIIEYRFPNIDAIESVSWSPNGKKIAFSGTYASFTDIYVYDIESKEVTNITNDVFSDIEPTWTLDSKSIIFSSDRGDKIEIGRYRYDYNILLHPDLNQKDLYKVTIGKNLMERLTNTSGWNETRPLITIDDRLIFISDQNGIPNVFEMNLNNNEAAPLTNLLQGVIQMSISRDGNRLALNTYNGGYLDIFLIRNPFSKIIDKPLEPNQWAKERMATSDFKRVPAIKYGYELFGNENDLVKLRPNMANYFNQDLYALRLKNEEKSESTNEAEKANETSEELDKESDVVDFRNYQFGSDAVLSLNEEDKFYEEELFEPQENKTDDGLFKPYKYKLKFSPEFSYGEGVLDTYYGAYGLTTVQFSDVLGDHRFGFYSNLVFDLRNSTYVVNYIFLKNRTNYYINYFHYATQYQTYSPFSLDIDLVRFRTYGFDIGAEYPLDRFRRINYTLSYINISRDFSNLSFAQTNSETDRFFYPKVAFTADHTMPGFLTPSRGYQYTISLTGSPPVTKNTIGFITTLGDIRKYFGMGYGYSIAIRGSGGASFGPDAQTFFMGGTTGWINYRWDGNDIPFDQLADIFLTQPALPMRGFSYNTLYGSKYGLLNLEFRFPLFAAILPGPIPVLPLYNITGIIFTDFGAAWGKDQVYAVLYNTDTEKPIPFYTNDAKLNFKVSRIQRVNVSAIDGKIIEDMVNNTDPYYIREIRRGDLLIGTGFGLRTILLGLPFRWDMAWPRNGGSYNKAIHYFSIGLDF